MRESLIFITALILTFLVGLLIPSPLSFQASKSVAPSRPTGASKNLIGIGNPDMNFEKSGDCFSVAKYWLSNGFCYGGTIDGEKGVVIIHPLTRNVGRFISQAFVVPSDATTLKIKVANIAGKTPWDKVPCPDCDSGVIVEVTDLTDWSEHPLDDFIISAKDGWVIKTYDITEFAGKPIILNIYSYAGGTNPWNGEWTAVGSVSIE